MTRVLVPLAEGFEDLEAITIVDLLRRAQIDVVTAGLKPGPVRGSRGTVVIPDTDLDQALQEQFDMMVLPGGQPGATNLQKDERIRMRLQEMVADNRLTAAICAAPAVLAAAGLLDGRKATSFPGAIDPEKYPNVHLDKEPVVRDGNIITSRGPGTAMDFSLSLIEILSGRKTRDTVESALQRPRL
jgi:4-methyl-5(b-hydroxyethyl)-thiazole monophosphate biosynthesis